MSGAVPTEVTGSATIYGRVGPARLHGWSLAETGGVDPAVVTIHAGTDNTGDIVARVDIPTGTSTTTFFADPAVRMSGGIHVEHTGGTLSGAVYWQ